MTQIVDVNDLSRSFGSKRALEGVSFQATAGRIYGLVAPTVPEDHAPQALSLWPE